MLEVFQRLYNVSVSPSLFSLCPILTFSFPARVIHFLLALWSKFLFQASSPAQFGVIVRLASFPQQQCVETILRFVLPSTSFVKSLCRSVFSFSFIHNKVFSYADQWHDNIHECMRARDDNSRVKFHSWSTE